LLFLVAIDMLFARTTRESITSEELKDAEQKRKYINIPYSNASPDRAWSDHYNYSLIRTAGNLNLKLAVIGAILLTFIITFLIFRFSDYFNKVVGRTGMLVMTRLMGLFLGAIAVDFIFTGIKGIFGLN